LCQTKWSTFFGQEDNGKDATYTICDQANATLTSLLVRKPTVCTGQPAELASFGSSVDDCEWIIADTLNALNTSNVDLHISECGESFNDPSDFPTVETPTAVPVPERTYTTEYNVSLFFSEVAEGNQNGRAQKWFEIFNPTATAVPLSHIRIEILVHKGSKNSTTGAYYINDLYLDTDEAGIVDKTMTELGAFQHLFVCHKDLQAVGTNTNGFQACDFFPKDTYHVVNYNGDDGLRLSVSGRVTDIFGQEGNPRDESFVVCGNENITAEDVVLIRRPNVCRGNPNPLKSFGTDAENCEWDIQPAFYVGNIDEHTSECGESFNDPSDFPTVETATAMPVPTPTSDPELPGDAVQVNNSEGIPVYVWALVAIGAVLIVALVVAFFLFFRPRYMSKPEFIEMDRDTENVADAEKVDMLSEPQYVVDDDGENPNYIVLKSVEGDVVKSEE